MADALTPWALEALWCAGLVVVALGPAFYAHAQSSAAQWRRRSVTILWAQACAVIPLALLTLSAVLDTDPTAMPSGAIVGAVGAIWAAVGGLMLGSDE